MAFGEQFTEFEALLLMPGEPILMLEEQLSKLNLLLMRREAEL
jgi:hypothetical protein